MPTTVVLEIPDAIQVGMDSGELFRFGGVIRDAGGQFVTFLADASTSNASPSKVADFMTKLADRAAAALKPGSSKEVLILAGAAAAVVGVVAGAMYASSKLQRKQAVESERVSDYSQSLDAYLRAAGNGLLDADGVGRLLADLDEMVSHVDEKGRRIKVDFTSEQGRTLHGLVLDFTGQLAAAHGLDAVLLLDFEKTKPRISDDESVEELRRHLMVQQRILREAP